MSVGLLQLADKLYQAVEAGSLENVKDCMMKGANVNLLSSNGRTSLGRAAELGHLDIVQQLLKADEFLVPQPTVKYDPVPCPLVSIYNTIKKEAQQTSGYVKNGCEISGSDHPLSTFEKASLQNDLHNHSEKNNSGEGARPKTTKKNTRNKRFSYNKCSLCGATSKRKQSCTKNYQPSLSHSSDSSLGDISPSSFHGDSSSQSSPEIESLPYVPSSCSSKAVSSNFPSRSVCTKFCDNVSSFSGNTNTCHPEGECSQDFSGISKSSCSKPSLSGSSSKRRLPQDSSSPLSPRCEQRFSYKSMCNKSNSCCKVVGNTFNLTAVKNISCSLNETGKLEDENKVDATKFVSESYHGLTDKQCSNFYKKRNNNISVTKDFQNKQPNIGYYVMEYKEESQPTSKPLQKESNNKKCPQCHHKDTLFKKAGKLENMVDLSLSTSDSEPNERKIKRKRRRSKHQAKNVVGKLPSGVECGAKKSNEVAEESWSMTMWHNSKWAQELQEEYQALGQPWPWPLQQTEACWCDVVDRLGCTPLHYAAHKGHQKIVEVLLDAGASVDRVDPGEMTPLHLAVDRGFLSVVETLIAHDASVNTRGAGEKMSALHIAASRGHNDIILLLLDNGARVNGLDSNDRTALIRATSSDHLESVKLLLSRGASVNIQQLQGYTALSEAVWIKSLPLTKLLLETGASAPNSACLLHFAADHCCSEIVEQLLTYGWPIDMRDTSGYTPLMYAAKKCHPPTVRVLLENGADPNVRNGNSLSTALHESVLGSRSDDDFTEVFRLFVKAGARLNMAAHIGDTPLFRAVLLHKSRAAELLLMHGVDVCATFPGMLGVELLRLAVYSNNRKFAFLLVLAGVPLYPCVWIPHGAGNEGSLHHALAYIRSQPFRLTDLCRIAIRRLLGERVVQRAPLLPIPPLLQRFLLLVGDETRTDFIKGQ